MLWYFELLNNNHSKRQAESYKCITKESSTTEIQRLLCSGRTLPIKQQQRVVTQINECHVCGRNRLDFTLVSLLAGPSASLQLTSSAQPKGYLGGSGGTRKACRNESRRYEFILATQDDAERLQG